MFHPTLHKFNSAALLLAVSAGLLSSPVLAQDQPQRSEEELAKLRQFEQEQKDAVAKKEAAAAAAAANAGNPTGSGRTKAMPAPQGPAGKTPPPGATGSAGNATGAATGAAPNRNQPVKGPGITVDGGASPSGSGRAAQPLKPDEVSLALFSEGIDLKVLVEYVADTLQINVTAPETLAGSVVLNAPVTIKKNELLKLLDALLEQYGFTIILDGQTGFYKILSLDGVPVTFDSELATTRIIPTPTVKPTALAEVLRDHMGAMQVAAVPGQPNAGARSRINYLDDLSVIVVTDSPRRIETMTQLINMVMARVAEQTYIRFDLEHLAASTARSRILELVGRSSSPTTPGQVISPQQAATLGLGSTNFDNLSDRLTADTQSNALILRGYEDEAHKIRALLAVLDRPNGMEYKQYFAGSAALQIAQLAERFGFGTVETVETANTQNQNSLNQPGNVRNTPSPLQMLQGNTQSTLGGPVLVVDPSRGAITYNGTASQQAALQKLIASFNPQLEVVEFRAYKIKNMPAPDMADLLTGLIFNEEVTSSDTRNSFLPGSNSRRSGSRDRSGSSRSSSFNRSAGESGIESFNNNNRTNNRGSSRTGGGGGGISVGGRTNGALALTSGAQPSEGGVAAIGGQDVFLLADEANNQVVVKATARDHIQIARLIDKLDQRRPQVNLEVQIVSVSANDDFRLAFEVQGVFDKGRDGVFNTNFGLGTFGTTTGSSTTTGSFVNPKSVVTTLAGLTTAVVRSDYVPIIMTALKRNADTRILSSPQLLVDDNEFAEIVSLDQQPTSTTDVGNSTSITGFGGYEEAGTTLSVLPSISEGGYVRLQYNITLSNFVGTGSNGLPPPRQSREVSSDNVTIPGNATIIVGGIKVDARGNTVVKVPLLGDIPIVGKLFSDTNKTHTSTRLYIFITPKILRDIHGGDVSLLTRGPAEDAEIDVQGPKLKPIMMRFNEKPAPSPLGSSAPTTKAPAQGPAPEGSNP